MSVPASAALGVVVADQLTKWVIRDYLVFRAIVEVFGEQFRLVYWGNKGAAFGMTLGGPAVHIALSLLALGLLGWVAWRTPEDEWMARWGFGLIVGGAVGNLIDRISLGYVVDFLDVGLSATVRWPAFNVADVAVVVGVALLIFGHWLTPKAESSTDSKELGAMRIPLQKPAKKSSDPPSSFGPARPFSAKTSLL